MILKFTVWVTSFILIPELLCAQSISHNTPTSLGKGGTGVTQTNIWSVLNNPAGTARFDSIGIAMGYYIPYLTPELASKNIIVAMPVKFGVISFSICHFGYESYQENNASINFSKYLTPNMSVAFQVNWQNNNAAQSRSGHQFYSGLGIHYQPYDSFEFGFYFSNPEKSNISIHYETIEIPSLFILGCNWNATESLSLSFETEKQIRFKNLVKLGLQYNIANIIWFRIGVLGKPINYTLGMGLRHQKICINVALAHHQTLGISSSIGFSFQLQKKK